MEYQLYKSYNLIHSTDAKKQTKTRTFQIIRAYIRYKYVDGRFIRPAFSFESRYTIEQLNNFISKDYCEEYDNLLLDVIFNAPISELVMVSGFGKQAEHILKTLRKENEK